MTPLLRTGAAGLATLGLLLDEESGDAEEQRRRIEARIAAENFGAVVGFAAGAAMAVKEKLDEHAALVGGKCFLVTSVFPGGASATPTDKLLQLIDTKLEREHHEQ